MPEQTFLRADEVAQELGVSPAYAYKLIRKLNAELQERGFITINGRISRRYFLEKLYDKGIEAMKGSDDGRL